MQFPRVVITGLGVVAPNGANVAAFRASLEAGRSGIQFWPDAAEQGFGCQVFGMPAADLSVLDRKLAPARRRVLNRAMELAAQAALECWADAGLAHDPEESNEPDWDTGLVLGTAIGAIDIVSDTVIPHVNAKQHRRLGSRIVERAMISGPAAALAGIFGLGGPCLTVSAACSSGSSAIHHGLQLLRTGRCCRVLVGGVEVPSLYTVAMFDSMRVVCRDFNADPHRASRPMSASAAGFVPAAGAGFLLLETLDAARSRAAVIHTELLSSAENSGGQRQDGTMTLASSEGVIRCVRAALQDANIPADAVSYINGHLTGTIGDTRELRNLAQALDRTETRMPYVNATKSLTGHCLGAAGAIEAIATVLQLRHGFLHPSVNCNDLHPELQGFAGAILREATPWVPSLALTVNFGFGDVNTCLLLQPWKDR